MEQHYPDLVRDNQPGKMNPTNYKNLESFNLNDYLNSENNQRNSSNTEVTDNNGKNSQPHKEDLHLANHLKNIYEISSYIKRSSINPHYNLSTNSSSSEPVSIKRHLSKAYNDYSTLDKNPHSLENHVVFAKKNELQEESLTQNRPSFNSSQNFNNNNNNNSSSKNNSSKITRKTVHCDSKKSVRNRKASEDIAKEDSNDNIYSWRRCQEMMITHMRSNKRQDKEALSSNPVPPQRHPHKIKRFSKSTPFSKKTPPRGSKQHSSHKTSLLEMFPTSKMADSRTLMISSGADSLHCFLTTNSNDKKKPTSQKKLSNHHKNTTPKQEWNGSSQGVSSDVMKSKMGEELKQKCREHIRKKAVEILKKEDFDSASDVESPQTSTHKPSLENGGEQVNLSTINEAPRGGRVSEDDFEKTLTENASKHLSSTCNNAASSGITISDHRGNQPTSSQSSGKTSTSYKSPVRNYQSQDIRSYMRRKKQQHRQQQLEAAKEAEAREEHKRKMLLKLKQFQQADLSGGKKVKQVKSLRNKGKSNYHKKTLAMAYNVEKWLEGQREIEEKRVKNEASRSFRMANNNEASNANKQNKTLNSIENHKMKSSGRWEMVMQNLRAEHLFFNKVQTSPTSFTATTTSSIFTTILTTTSSNLTTTTIFPPTNLTTTTTSPPTNLITATTSPPTYPTTTSVQHASPIQTSSLNRDINHSRKYKQLDKYKYSASCLSDKLAHMESILRDLKKRREPFFPRSTIDNAVNTVTRDSTTSPLDHPESTNTTYIDAGIQNDLDSYNNNNKATCVTPSILHEPQCNNKSISTTFLNPDTSATRSKEIKNTNASLQNATINPTSLISAFNQKFSSSLTTQNPPFTQNSSFTHDHPFTHDRLFTHELMHSFNNSRVPDDLKKVEFLNGAPSYNRDFLGGLKSPEFLSSELCKPPTSLTNSPLFAAHPLTFSSMNPLSSMPFSSKPSMLFSSTPSTTSSYVTSSSSLFIQPPPFLTSTPPSTQAVSITPMPPTTSSCPSTKPTTSNWMSSLRDIFPSEDVCIKMRKQLIRSKSPIFDLEGSLLYASTGCNEKWNSKGNHDMSNLNDSTKEEAAQNEVSRMEVDNVNDLNNTLFRTFLSSPDHNTKTTARKVRREVLSQTSGNLFDSLNESNAALNESLLGKEVDKKKRRMKKKVVTDDVFPTYIQSNASFTSTCTSDAGGLPHDSSLEQLRTPSLMPTKQLERFLVKREMTLKRRRQRALMMIEKSRLLDDQERQVELLEKEASSLAKKAALDKCKSKAVNGAVEVSSRVVDHPDPSKEAGRSEGRKEEKKRNLRKLIQEYEKELAELSMTDSSILSSSFSQTLRDGLERFSNEEMCLGGKKSFYEVVFYGGFGEESVRGASDLLGVEGENMKKTEQINGSKTEYKNDAGLRGDGRGKEYGGMVGTVASTDDVNILLNDEQPNRDVKDSKIEASDIVEACRSMKVGELRGEGEANVCMKPPKKKEQVDKVGDNHSVFSKDSLERVVVVEEVVEIKVESEKDSMDSDTLNDESSQKWHDKTEDDVEDIDAEHNLNKFSMDSLMVPDVPKMEEMVQRVDNLAPKQSSETTPSKEAVKSDNDGILDVSEPTSSTSSTQTKDLIGDVDDLIKVIKSADLAVKSVSSEKLNETELGGMLKAKDQMEVASSEVQLEMKIEKEPQPGNELVTKVEKEEEVKKPDAIMMTSFDSSKKSKNEELVYKEDEILKEEKLAESLCGWRGEEKRNTACSLVDQLLNDLLRETIDSVMQIRKNKLMEQNVAEKEEVHGRGVLKEGNFQGEEVVLENFELSDDKYDFEEVAEKMCTTAHLFKSHKTNNIASPQVTPASLTHPSSSLQQATFHAPRVTSFVPQTQEALASLISTILELYWQQRRCGLSWQDLKVPESFLEGGDVYFEQGVVCQKAFKTLLWDLVGEILTSLYCIEHQSAVRGEQGRHEGFSCDVTMLLAAEKLIKRSMLYDTSCLPNTAQELEPIMVACVSHLVTSCPSNLDLAIFSGVQASKVSCHPERNEGIRQILAMEMRVEEASWNNLDNELREVKEETFEGVLQWLINDTLVNVKQAFSRKCL